MILDYPCKGDLLSGPGLWPGISFPQAYTEAEMMADLALKMRKKEGKCACLLPFCHTLEAEALGANIVLGDGHSGPRVREFRYHDLSQMETLPPMNMNTPRLQETIKACKLLQEQGEQVIFQISGPLTILGSLLPSERLFPALRKEPELLMKLFDRLGKELLQLMKYLEQEGIRLFSYADPSGGVALIGPKWAEKIACGFTVDFLKKAAQELKRESLLFLCPKTAFALVGSSCGHWVEHRLSQAHTYQEGAISLQGQLRFVGQSCINRWDYTCDSIKELKLEEMPC